MFRLHLFRVPIPTLISVLITLLTAFSASAESGRVIEHTGSYRAHYLVLPIVNFATNSAELNTKSRSDLGELVQMLNEDPQMKLRVVGHTDNVGSKQANQRLSERRAEAVVGYMVNNGVSRQRLNLHAVSENQPMKSNMHESGRADNRRVVFAEE